MFLIISGVKNKGDKPRMTFPQNVNRLDTAQNLDRLYRPPLLMYAAERVCCRSQDSGAGGRDGGDGHLAGARQY